MKTEQPKLVAELRSQNGPLARHAVGRASQAVKIGTSGFDQGLVIAGAIFRNLVASVSALRDLAAAHGAQSLRVHEAPQGEDDPLRFLR